MPTKITHPPTLEGQTRIAEALEEQNEILNDLVLEKVTSVNGQTGDVELDKDDIGLSNVDNTSDLNKPISTATQTALNSKLNKAGDTMTGNLAMGGNKISKLADGTISSDAVNYGQLKSLNEITDLTVYFHNPSSLASASDITAKKCGRIVIVSGYLNSSVEIANQTHIGKVDGVRFLFETFATAGCPDGTLTRIKLDTFGNIVLEKNLAANQWASFTFTAFVQ